MDLNYHTVHTYKTQKGALYPTLRISYQIFGQKLHTAPIVIINHALTGNSDVVSEKNGWWKDLVGYGKTVDLENYTVIAFNILGNGYDGTLIENYQDFTAKDIAQLFNDALLSLQIEKVYALMGGSLGGGIAWEMAVLQPKLFKHLITIASDWKSTDWVIAQSAVQESVLVNSKNSLQDARKMAMLFYRSPVSFSSKFNRSKAHNESFNVATWLNHHGAELENRFEKTAYLMMNHLLASIDITSKKGSFDTAVKQLDSEICQIGIDSDLLFVKDENIATHKRLNKLGKINQYHEIKSIHGHDAFLIEHEQINRFLTPIFKRIKTINIALFGKGNVGGTLINQILNSKEKIKTRKSLNLNVFAIAATEKVLLNKNGIDPNWQEKYNNSASNTNAVKQITAYAKKHNISNLIAIDNTASSDFINNYQTLAENGFHLISSNKIANTLPYVKFKKLRNAIRQNDKQYLYETNVGAGLPIINTIKLLHDSGENITRIRGVFSGSLSYLFNTFSESNQPFSKILKTAIENGFTEPDAREDLSGNDVARKLLILARELDLENEFEEIEIQNLIPEELKSCSQKDFINNLEKFNPFFNRVKQEQTRGNVLRYVGDLSGDLQQTKGKMTAKLISVSKNSALGNLEESDSVIEIYTESYKNKPIIVQGAGAGAEVTARGVFGDLLRISGSI